MAARRTSVIAIAAIVLACGGDDSDDGATPTSGIDPMVTGTTGDVPDDGDDTSSTSPATDATTTGLDESTTGASAESDTGDSTTGEAFDPSYPPIGPGGCADGATLMLPGASVCAPFCAGAGAPCPDAASGSATPTCTPFEMDGGSGTPCTDHAQCPQGEACGVADTCIAVAFWGCRLLCEGAAVCPDAMTCTSIGACGYPG